MPFPPTKPSTHRKPLISIPEIITNSFDVPMELKEIIPVIKENLQRAHSEKSLFTIIIKEITNLNYEKKLKESKTKYKKEKARGQLYNKLLDISIDKQFNEVYQFHRNQDGTYDIYSIAIDICKMFEGIGIFQSSIDINHNIAINIIKSFNKKVELAYHVEELIFYTSSLLKEEDQKLLFENFLSFLIHQYDKAKAKDERESETESLIYSFCIKSLSYIEPKYHRETLEHVSKKSINKESIVKNVSEIYKKFDTKSKKYTLKSEAERKLLKVITSHNLNILEINKLLEEVKASILKEEEKLPQKEASYSRLYNSFITTARFHQLHGLANKIESQPFIPEYMRQILKYSRSEEGFKLKLSFLNENKPNIFITKYDKPKVMALKFMLTIDDSKSLEEHYKNIMKVMPNFFVKEKVEAFKEEVELIRTNIKEEAFTKWRELFNQEEVNFKEIPFDVMEKYINSEQWKKTQSYDLGRYLIFFSMLGLPGLLACKYQKSRQASVDKETIESIEKYLERNISLAKKKATQEQKAKKKAAIEEKKIIAEQKAAEIRTKQEEKKEKEFIESLPSKLKKHSEELEQVIKKHYELTKFINSKELSSDKLKNINKIELQKAANLLDITTSEKTRLKKIKEIPRKFSETIGKLNKIINTFNNILEDLEQKLESKKIKKEYYLNAQKNIEIEIEKSSKLITHLESEEARIQKVPGIFIDKKDEVIAALSPEKELKGTAIEANKAKHAIEESTKDTQDPKAEINKKKKKPRRTNHNPVKEISIEWGSEADRLKAGEAGKAEREALKKTALYQRVLRENPFLNTLNFMSNYIKQPKYFPDNIVKLAETYWAVKGLDALIRLELGDQYPCKENPISKLGSSLGHDIDSNLIEGGIKKLQSLKNSLMHGDGSLKLIDLTRLNDSIIKVKEKIIKNLNKEKWIERPISFDYIPDIKEPDKSELDFQKQLNNLNLLINQYPHSIYKPESLEHKALLFSLSLLGEILKEKSHDEISKDSDLHRNLSRYIRANVSHLHGDPENATITEQGEYGVKISHQYNPIDLEKEHSPVFLQNLKDAIKGLKEIQQKYQEPQDLSDCKIKKAIEEKATKEKEELFKRDSL